jgi:hypothetical protein
MAFFVEVMWKEFSIEPYLSRESEKKREEENF